MLVFKKAILLVLSLFLTSQLLYAQNNCNCCTENHNQFDFWVGDWVVYDTLGNQVGENLIVKLEDGCIINEHWKGSKGSTGRSYNYFNAKDTTWNQLWIDNSGENLVLKGKAEPDKMILKSELKKGQKVDWYYDQITWSKNKDGSVTQLWERFDKNNNLLSVAFKGIYRKKG